MEQKSQICIKNPVEIMHDILECPSCNIKIPISEVPNHFEMEMQRLKQIQTDAAAKITEELNSATVEAQRKKRFQRVQRNRQTRLKRSRKRSTPTTHTCPICNGSFSQQEIQRHAERCLRKSNGHTNNGDGHSSNEDDDNEDGYNEEYEEYEWAGQKRIRASSLLEGGYSSLGIGTGNRSQENNEEDEDLNVDEDDTQIYGPTQYDEADVIPTEDDASSYMRSLITGNAKSANSQSKEHNGTKNDENKNENSTTTNTQNETAMNCEPCSSSTSTNLAAATSSSSSTANASISHYQQIIDSLKAKLRYYENHVPSKYKCLICLDDYRKPAISVACWHVHCEDCWLRSLGTRKLCPQCNLITTPKDLRRIYM